MYHGNLAASLAAGLALGQPALAWNVRHSLYDLASEKPLTRQVIRANRVLSRRPETIIYNSRLSREQHERFGFNARRGVVIPNGFDLNRLRSDSEVGAVVRREFGIAPEALVIGHVARFHPMKDHVGFLRAAVAVARHLPRARFLMVGREVSVAKPEFAGIIPLDLLPRFVFTEERTDVPRLMQAMDVLCSSSWSEAFPNVLGEAMACGVPCVTTDVGDSAAIVGETGIVVPPSDSAALARALSTMLEKRHETRRDLGRHARQRIATRYSIDAVTDRYTLLYENLIGGTLRPPVRTAP
jgi:glycosyltransferase involved in cell wall biosynthesis